MEALLATEMSVPLHQIMFLMVLLTVALLFGYLRLGLFFSYVFVFYWGNIFNIQSVLNSADPDITSISSMFVGFGMIIVFLALVGFLLNRE